MPKKDAVVKEGLAVKTTEELILDFGKGKYSAIPLTALWAKELKKREENRHLTPAELLDAALRDVLGGKIGWKDLKKASAEAAPAAKAEK